MQSEQERLIKRFMERSFGAQFLFLPQKYYKGHDRSKPKEPADLAWVNGSLVVLFYLQRSEGARATLEKQIYHNRGDADGYLRLWKTGQSRFSLRGRNYFGDECFVPFSSAKVRITIFVVSVQCGVMFANLKHEPDGVCLVVPEALLHWISEFGGTLTDLLQIAHFFLEGSNGGSARTPGSFHRLVDLVTQYVGLARSGVEEQLKGNGATSLVDYDFIARHLSLFRIPTEMSGAASKRGREHMARIFGDMSLTEHTSLATASAAAIEQSGQHFERSALVSVGGQHYDFFVNTQHLGAKNCLENFNAVLSKMGDPVRPTLLVTHFHYGCFENDVRAPAVFALVAPPSRSHAEVLVEKIIVLRRSHEKSGLHFIA